MTRVPYTKFNQTRLVPLKTYTNGHPDNPPNPNYKKTLWVERGEDFYAFSNPQFRDKSVLIVRRKDWLKAETACITCDGKGHTTSLLNHDFHNSPQEPVTEKEACEDCGGTGAEHEQSNH